MLSTLAVAALAQVPLGLEAWPVTTREARLTRDAGLVAAVDPEALARWHDLVASVPHPAGSPGDALVIERLAGAFESLGLDVEVHEFVAFLSRSIDAGLWLVSPAEVELPLREGVLPGSKWSASADDALRLGWNAYSGSADVTGEVVYANYGRREDFRTLAELGVDCRGKIVLARYGGNFRGYKAKYAEEAGAAGLVIFTDPADSGYGRGVVSPEGGWANCDQIQRGSLKTLPWSGDPLTPGAEATAEAERLEPDEVALPRIPVQPVGWQAATQIMGPMRGGSVPAGWQGGLPFRYRLEGGPDVRVRLMVEQERSLVRTANVLGSLRGTESGEDAPGILIGSHHDAWIYGANDPTSGTIAMLETARVLAERAREEGPPRRTITFAGWGAEEHGIIGSTEWVEGNRERLIASGDLYVNLDAAASGMRLGVSASPSLSTLFRGAAERVPQPGDPAGRSALDAWRGDGAEPRVGFLGGGSDHVSFLALCALPSASIGARGAPGTAYHSLYDDLAWYRRVVGADYASAALVARIVTVAVDRASMAPVLPLDWSEPARALARTSRGLGEQNAETLPGRAVLALVGRAEAQAERADALERRFAAASRAGALSDAARAEIEAAQRRAERAWLHEPGLPGRPWFRNLYAAPDETSGYAAWPLPGLQKAVLESDAALGAEQLALLAAVLDRRDAALERIASAIGADPASDPVPGAGGADSAEGSGGSGR
ncbi:MAG: M28 family peptidase [Planctomycetota bacterium]